MYYVHKSEHKSKGKPGPKPRLLNDSAVLIAASKTWIIL